MQGTAFTIMNTRYIWKSSIEIKYNLIQPWILLLPLKMLDMNKLHASLMLYFFLPMLYYANIGTWQKLENFLVNTPKSLTSVLPLTFCYTCSVMLSVPLSVHPWIHPFFYSSEVNCKPLNNFLKYFSMQFLYKIT